MNAPVRFNARTSRIVESGKFYDLSDDAIRGEMQTIAPSIFATKPSKKMSEKYNFISTIKIAEALQEKGLQCVDYGQQHSKSRDPKFQEHLLRFRMPELEKIKWNVGDSFPELVLINSHNGYQALRAYAGIFRMVCSNGLVVADEQFGYHKQRHIHVEDAQAHAEKHIFETIEKINVISVRINAMQNTVLSKHFQNQLAKAMMEVRKAPDWLEAEMVLESHRPEDEPVDDKGSRTMWQTFNVVQENLITKADALVLEKSDSVPRTRRLRPITGRISDFRTNGLFWNAMEEFIAANDDFKTSIPTVQQLMAA
jgi:Domain of unknown function (DUF932)